MAINFDKPDIGDNYSTGYTQNIRDSIKALAKLLDGETITANFAGVKRYNAANDLFEEWSGTAWVEMPLAYVKLSSYTAADVLTKLLTVDGAGSGIDADLLDGNNSAAFALLAGAQFTGNVNVGSGTRALIDTNGDFHARRNGPTGVCYLGDQSGGSRYVFYDGTKYEMPGALLNVNGALVWTQGNDGSGSGLDADMLDGVQGSAYAPLASPNFSGTPQHNGIEIGYRSVPRVSTTGLTATVNERGKCYASTGTITVPNSTFASGDALSVYNDSGSAITIAQGSGFTLRQVGTGNTGNRTLAARGLVTIWFNSAAEAVISGGGLS